MREIIFTVSANERIAVNTYRIILEGDTSDITRPGQFVNIKIPGKYLRRPLSVCDWEDGKLTLIYKVVGEGTCILSNASLGEKFSVLLALGNGYDLSLHDNPVLVGGGVGVPPLYGLAKRLLQRNIRPSVVMGFNKSDECFYDSEFRSLGLDVKVTTLDGSSGVRGVVTDVLDGGEYVYACGPLPMLWAVHRKVADGQFSFEARMGCGFGVCMGCSIRTRGGFRQICKDGPIFNHSEIIWKDD